MSDLIYTDWYTIKVDTSNEHVYNYEIYEVFYKEEDNRFYNKANARAQDTSDLDEADPVGTGFIKFDGCSHWDFKPNNTMLHLCGRDNMREFQEVLNRCFNKAEEIITI